MLTSVWSRACAVGRTACASTREEATSASTRRVRPTTSGIPPPGTSASSSQTRFRKPSFLSVLGSQTPSVVLLNSQDITDPGARKVTACSFFGDRVRHELTPRPRGGPRHHDRPSRCPSAISPAGHHPLLLALVGSVRPERAPPPLKGSSFCPCCLRALRSLST